MLTNRFLRMDDGRGGNWFEINEIIVSFTSNMNQVWHGVRREAQKNTLPPHILIYMSDQGTKIANPISVIKQTWRSQNQKPCLCWCLFWWWLLVKATAILVQAPSSPPLFSSYLADLQWPPSAPSPHQRPAVLPSKLWASLVSVCS